MKDFIGQKLNEGDFVAGLYSENNTPAIFTVHGFTPKKVRLSAIDGIDDLSLKYPHDLIKIDADAIHAKLATSPEDHIGQDLAIDDYVYGSDGTYVNPAIYKITGFIGRKATVIKVMGESWVTSADRLLTDLIKIDSRVITMHVLTKEYK